MNPREWATSQTATVGVDRMNPGITILPLPSANGLFRGQMSAKLQDKRHVT
jgi:hypothetical protein